MYQLLEIIQCMNRTGLSESYSPIAVWLHQDGFKQTSAACNRARGWYGTKGKCKRGKKTDDVEGMARNSAKESIQSRTGKKKPEKTLKAMFKEADKVGNKYQDPKDVAANKAEIKAIAKAPRKPKAVAAKTVVEKNPIAAKVAEKLPENSGSDKAIKNYEEFKGVAAAHMAKIDRDFNYNGLVPIVKVRESLGKRVSKDDFDKHMREMQADDLHMLVSAPTGAATQTDDETIKTALGHSRRDIQFKSDKISAAAKAELKKMDEADSKAADKVAGRIKSQKEFESAVDKAIGDKKLVHLNDIRKAIGGKVTRKEFSDMMRQSETHQLVGGEDPNITPERAQNSITTSLGKPRYYAQKIK